MKKIVLTGGGTAGHVTPNIALLNDLKKENYNIYYIGRKENNAIEKELIEKENIPYYGISSGKLRRYFSLENVKDVFKISKGVSDAYKILRKIKPNVVFSKGGFVTVPVIVACKALNIPVVIHESDYSVGLANKICMPLSKSICTSFSETNKGIVTGPPVRYEIFTGSITKGNNICNFKENKPTILVMGGSSGAKFINNLVRKNIDILTKKYNIIHLCGKGSLCNIKKDGYFELEYATIELKDLLKITDTVITRAGSNSIFEFLALKIPMVLIPLSKNVSRGDQILNAKSFENKGYGKMLEEENITNDLFLNVLDEIVNNKKKYIFNMEKDNFTNGVPKIIEEIKKHTKG